ncbi:hypothetical protein AQUCO_02700060v1 [Aquilegia coerulea]|uniref:Uncharacterized protein n=1 Tax=Aquilegia coerulea TaxID=218851 RepID=A0A2G5D4Z7_AQUCA|nr:hypothetical protein AQUCO_02700060v1 [Aquilegia coerulea]
MQNASLSKILSIQFGENQQDLYAVYLDIPKHKFQTLKSSIPNYSHIKIFIFIISKVGLSLVENSSTPLSNVSF